MLRLGAWHRTQPFLACVAMSCISEEGFLSDEAERWRQENVTRNGRFYDHFRRVNAFCHRYLAEQALSNQDGTHVFSTSLFARSLTIFQAMVTLSERGFSSEVLACDRMILEIGFKLGAIAADPKMITQ